MFSAWFWALRDHEVNTDHNFVGGGILDLARLNIVVAVEMGFCLKIHLFTSYRTRTRAADVGGLRWVTELKSRADVDPGIGSKWVRIRRSASEPGTHMGSGLVVHHKHDRPLLPPFEQSVKGTEEPARRGYHDLHMRKPSEENSYDNLLDDSA